MPFYNDIERRRGELQAQYEVLSEKIKQLRVEFAAVSGGSRRFELEKDIERAESERMRTGKQIEDLEGEKIYEALLRLDYKDQVRLFREFIRTHQIGAFLIHGASEYGQRWLLKRLLQSLRINSKPIDISFSRKGHSYNITALWRELAGRLGLMAGNSKIDQIVESLGECWRSRDVVLIFNEVNYISEAMLNDLICEFWGRLAEMAYRLTPPSNFKLFVFLVDYDGCVSLRNHTLVDHLPSPGKPHCAIKLPAIEIFSAEILTDWIQHVDEELPDLFDNLDGNVQSILENSDNGIPERAFVQICHLCGYDWYQGEDRWLKI
jgi:hypothetical protein